MYRFVCFFILWSGWAIKATADEKNDVEFILNQKGLEVIVEEVKSFFLSGDDLRSLPDIHGKPYSNVSFVMTDVKYLARIGKLEIKPRQDFVNVDLTVARTVVKAGKLNIQASLFGRAFHFICDGISFDFDKETPQPLSGDVGATMVDGEIKLHIQNITYLLNRKDIRVEGPRSCTGTWGARQIVKWVVASVLRQTRSILENEMVQILSDVLPTIEEILNKYTRQSFDISFDGVSPLPVLAVNVSTTPSAVRINEEGLVLSMKTTFDEPKNRRGTQKKMLHRSGNVLLGQVALSPNMATNLLQEAYPAGIDYIELNELFPAMNRFLTTSTASIVWPGIINEDLTKTYLKVKMRLSHSPVFGLEPETRTLFVDLKGLDVIFQVHKEDEWQDYFHMKTDVRGFASAKIYNGVLSFHIDERSELFVDGKFLGEFTNRSDLHYDAEMAEFLFSGVLDFLHGSAPMLWFEMPISNIAGVRVTADEVVFDDSFVRVGVVRTYP